MNVTLALHRNALRQPSHPALVGERGVFTYGHLDRLVWRGAAYFRDAGLRPGERVLLSLVDPVLHVVTSLALARLGVAYFAITPSDTRLMVERVAQRIGARALVTRSGLAKARRFSVIPVDAKTFTTTGPITGNLMCEDADQLWLSRTSSGTTGKPKLLAASHAGWEKNERARQLSAPIAASDVFLSMTRPYFFPALACHLGALDRGATVVLPSSIAAGALLSLITRARVNSVLAVTSLLQRLLHMPGSAPVISRLSTIITGGATVPRPLREQVLELTPGLQVVLACAEMGALTSTWGMEVAWLPDTVGRPVPYGEIEIVDDAGRSLPPGEVGEIRVRRDAIVSGYFDDPAADERFFRAGWFHPGDLACWSDDGQVLFKGRADDMIVSGHTKVFPSEIESCLQEHPDVLEAIAFPLPSEGQGNVPAAAVRVRVQAREADLIGFCRERIGMRYPHKVMIVEDFPRNAMGKPLKREMARMMAEAEQ